MQREAYTYSKILIEKSQRLLPENVLPTALFTACDIETKLNDWLKPNNSSKLLLVFLFTLSLQSTNINAEATFIKESIS